MPGTPIDALAELCGVTLGTGSAQQLESFLDLLERWNQTYNLTAVRTREAMRVQHIADCLAAVPALRRGVAAAALPEPVHVLDVGSGGGLPAVVLAVVCPEWQIWSVDAVGKKAAFVKQVGGSLGLLNLHAQHGRIEAVDLPKASLITSRAFASLELFTRLSEPHLSGRGIWAAMKGQVPHEEIAALPTGVEAFHVEPVEVPNLNAERCLVWMRRSAAPGN